METLEIKPIKNKKITLYLIRNKNQRLDNSQLKNLKSFLKKEKFRFAIIDLNEEEIKKSYESVLSRFLDKFWIPYYSIDIPDNVRDFLTVDIIEKEALINELEMEYATLCDEHKEDSYKAQSLKIWMELLKNEIDSQKKSIQLTIKPKWIVKKVLDIANMIRNDAFSIMHFTHEEIFSELKILFENYNIKVKKIDLNNININKIIT
ncbi:MAG: hypothetical protein EAX89_03875 [Candidatus Lokiarchaeota archaeon]|nr:hypothetical protein [Candidatus Lokiarchaeota archaeon]